MHKAYGMLGICLFMLSSCDSDSKDERILPDWAVVMQAESAQLAAQQPEVWMQHEVLGVVETSDTNVVAWESVYGFFLDAALPIEVMQSGFILETQVNDNDSVLLYKALKRNRRPQQLRLVYTRANAELMAVEIENETNNMFYESAQSLRYAKGDSLLVLGMNKLRWQDRKSYRQLIRFHK